MTTSRTSPGFIYNASWTRSISWGFLFVIAMMVAVQGRERRGHRAIDRKQPSGIILESAESFGSLSADTDNLWWISRHSDSSKIGFYHVATKTNGMIAITIPGHGRPYISQMIDAGRFLVLIRDSRDIFLFDKMEKIVVERPLWRCDSTTLITAAHGANGFLYCTISPFTVDPGFLIRISIPDAHVDTIIRNTYFQRGVKIVAHGTRWYFGLGDGSLNQYDPAIGKISTLFMRELTETERHQVWYQTRFKIAPFAELQRGDNQIIWLLDGVIGMYDIHGKGIVYCQGRHQLFSSYKDEIMSLSEDSILTIFKKNSLISRDTIDLSEIKTRDTNSMIRWVSLVRIRGIPYAVLERYRNLLLQKAYLIQIKKRLSGETSERL